MSNKPVKFASAIFVALCLSTTVFVGTGRAADDCLTEPNGATPQGKHWFYRIERGSGRHCWYLRGEDEKSARAATPDSASPAPAPPPRGMETSNPRAIADAHAEWPTRTPVGQDPGAATAPAASPPAEVTGSLPPDNAPRAQVVTRWPDSSAVLPSLNSPPQTSGAAPDVQADATTSEPPPATVPPPPAQAMMPMERNIGSLQKLLLVAFGALALAGLTGSAVYRLAAARRQARARRDRWPSRTAPKLVREKPMRDPNIPTMAPWVEPDIGRTAPVRDTSDADEPVDVPNERVERIEDFLARLTRQLQAELDGPRAERQRAAN